MCSTRIVLADDHPIFRDALRCLLMASPGLQVVGEADTGREALARVAELSPDVLLLDLAMPAGSGFDVLRALEGGKVRTIVLTAEAERWQFVEALQLGARGLVLKSDAPAALVACIDAVMKGNYWFGGDWSPDALHAFAALSAPAQPPAASLTASERRVVAGVLAGCSNRDIAQELGLSHQTVKNYLSHIFDKVGVSSRLELAMYAIHHRLPVEATQIVPYPVRAHEHAPS